MTDKKALFIEAMSADPAFVGEVSENRFNTFITRTGNDGNPENVVTAEYQVWTDEEAASFGYLSGGMPTTDESLKIYRIF